MSGPAANPLHDLRQALEHAFGGVTREGGVSWTQSIERDLLAVAGKDFTVAHREDDRSWREVAGDPGWDPDAGIGGWAFLDGVGLRYYLAAAMWRSLEGGEVGCLAWQFRRPLKGASRRRFEDRWTLDAAQHQVAVRFAAFMLERAFERGDQSGHDEWEAAISSWMGG
jgi:hypothetical protein